METIGLGTSLESVKSKRGIDFDQLIAVRNSFEEDTLDWGFINDATDALEANGTIDEVANKVIERIRADTDYLRELDEAGLIPEMAIGYRDQYLPRINAKLHHRPVRVLETSRFSHESRVITLVSHDFQSTNGSFLRHLAKTGYFSSPLIDLIHEATHAMQIKPLSFFQKVSLFPYSGVIFGNEEMLEIHAVKSGYREDVQATTNLIELVTLSLKAKRESGNKAKPKPVNADKVFFGAIAVDQLKAMGFNSVDVSHLIGSPGRWNQKTGEYPKIQRAIDNKKIELSLSDDDLENLVIAYRLEKDIQRLHARKIAQEEISKAMLSPEVGK